MDINQLRYFVEICNCGSLSKAAEKVHLSQQGLSSSIRRLESELGCNLFYRKANSLVLTDTGFFVLKEAQKILKHATHIYELCNDNKNVVLPIRVMISYSIIPRLSPKLQKLLLSCITNINVSLKEAYTEECVDAVENDDADFAIIYGEVNKENIESVALDNLKQVFIVNKDHTLADRKTVRLKDLDSIPFIAPEEPSYPRQLLNDMFKSRGLRFNVAYECGRPRQVLDLISNNPSFISRIVESEITEADREKIRVLELDDFPFFLPISLLHKKDKPMNHQEKEFFSFTLDAYKNFSQRII